MLVFGVSNNKKELSESNQECAELTLINHSQAFEEVNFNKAELAT